MCCFDEEENHYCLNSFIFLIFLIAFLFSNMLTVGKYEIKTGKVQTPVRLMLKPTCTVSISEIVVVDIVPE